MIDNLSHSYGKSSARNSNKGTQKPNFSNSLNEHTFFREDGSCGRKGQPSQLDTSSTLQRLGLNREHYCGNSEDLQLKQDSNEQMRFSFSVPQDIEEDLIIFKGNYDTDNYHTPQLAPLDPKSQDNCYRNTKNVQNQPLGQASECLNNDLTIKLSSLSSSSSKNGRKFDRELPENIMHDIEDIGEIFPIDHSPKELSYNSTDTDVEQSLLDIFNKRVSNTHALEDNQNHDENVPEEETEKDINRHDIQYLGYAPEVIQMNTNSDVDKSINASNHKHHCNPCSASSKQHGLGRHRLVYKQKSTLNADLSVVTNTCGSHQNHLHSQQEQRRRRNKAVKDYFATESFVRRNSTRKVRQRVKINGHQKAKYCNSIQKDECSRFREVMEAERLAIKHLPKMSRSPQRMHSSCNSVSWNTNSQMARPPYARNLSHKFDLNPSHSHLNGSKPSLSRNYSLNTLHKDHLISASLSTLPQHQHTFSSKYIAHNLLLNS
ncbi:unnamed protein product [Moneuplotes crassus]|uniref:Uncharacterized protein n=1 Tax=Euplotes crassus TaxID=5936 RepID=A0AAD1Y7C2_EUPCR|nr:unnamed protein product [Moneuplotes crassus]